MDFMWETSSHTIFYIFIRKEKIFHN
jgi:hypothetical protein